MVLGGAGCGGDPAQRVAECRQRDFTVAAWIIRSSSAQAGIVALEETRRTQGWYLGHGRQQGRLRLEGQRARQSIQRHRASPAGAIRANTWQHVAAVVRRGKGETRLYVNGYPVARGTIGPADLDNPKVDLQLGRIGAPTVPGEFDEVRLYRRALTKPKSSIARTRKAVCPRRRKPQDVTLTLGERQFSAQWQQPAFLAVRLDAGSSRCGHECTGPARLDRIVLTPLAADDDLAQAVRRVREAVAAARRAPGPAPRLRQHARSGRAAQTVASDELSRFVFEGAIRNFPSPEVEKDNVNYLAGIREIGVRSEYTDGRDMPRLLIRSVEFEGPFYDAWPPASHRNIFVDSDRKDDPPAYARRIIRDVRDPGLPPPVTAAGRGGADGGLREIVRQRERVSGEREGCAASGADVAAVPVPDREQQARPAAEPLDNYELASKLSYFLWNGPPDRDDVGAGREPARCASSWMPRVARMIDDPRFSRFASEFASQWLALDKFQVLEPDRNRFPKLTRDTRAQLRQEPVEFVAVPDPQQPAGAESDRVRFRRGERSRRQLLRPGDKTESGFRFVPIRARAPATWAACSRRRRSWRGCPTAANRTR